MKEFKLSCPLSFYWLILLFLGQPHYCFLMQGQVSSQSTVDAPITKPSDTEDDALSQAIRLLAENRLGEALEYAKQAEESSPEKIETWIILGKIYLNQGTDIRFHIGFPDLFRRDLFGMAEENFRKALQMDPLSLDAKNHLSFTLFLLKNIPAAEDEARQTLKEHPENAYAHYLLGKAQVEYGKISDSIPHFQAALTHNAEMLDARISLIKALVAVERRPDAAAEVLELSKIYVNYPELSQLAQSIYESDELYNDALGFYDALLAMDSERMEIRYRLGWVLYCLNRMEEAEKVFDDLLAAEPMHERALYQKGYLRLKEGKHEEAYALFKRVLEQDSEFSDYVETHLQYLVQRKVKDGDYEGAIEIMDFVLQHNPYNIIVMADRALTLSNWNQVKEADAAYEELIQLGSWDSSFFNDYALHLMGTQRTEAGLAMLQRAIDIDENIDSLENLGAYYYFNTNHLEKAEGYLQKVVIQDPERSKALILLESIGLQREFCRN